MDNWFQSKWFVRAVALVMAVSLYFVVYTEEEPTSRDVDFFGNTDETEIMEDVPVNVRIDTEKFVVSGVPETVSVTVEGSNSVVKRIIKQRNFDIYVDLTKLGEGEHTVEIKYENIPEELDVFIEPKTIDVIIEERSTRNFKVNVDFINQDQLPVGYELGEYSVEPEEVAITSSKSVVDKISLVKVFVNVAGLEESIKNREVPIKVYDSQGNELRVRIEPESVLVSADVSNPSKVVPVMVKTKGKLPDGYTLTSMKANVEEVEIFGTTKKLSEINEVVAELDLSEVKKSDTVRTKLNLPEGVVAPELEQIEVSIELEQEKVIKEVPVNVLHLEEGQTIEFNQPKEEKINISIEGNESAIREITKEDLRVLIDLEGLDEGEHRVPIEVEGPEKVTIKPEYDDITVEIK